MSIPDDLRVIERDGIVLAHEPIAYKAGARAALEQAAEIADDNQRSACGCDGCIAARTIAKNIRALLEPSDER